MRPIVNVPEEERATEIGNVHKKLVKMAHVVPEISSRTDRQTHRRTYSSQYFATAPAGEVISFVAVIMRTAIARGGRPVRPMNVRRPPTRKPSRWTWAVSPPAGCYRPRPPSPFIITSQNRASPQYYLAVRLAADRRVRFD